MKRGAVLAIAAGTVVLSAAAAPVLLDFRGTPDSTASTEEAQDAYLTARTKGDSAAPITIYEIADFQCPACRTFWAQTLPVLEREYVASGKARIVFINLPLASIHANAPAAHELAMCAARQDRFWPVHDLLYRHQDAWARLADPREYLLTLADSADVAVHDLKACLESGAAMLLIESEATQVFRQGIRSTPSFVVERSLIPGAAPIDAWRPLLDSIYQEKTRRR